MHAFVELAEYRRHEYLAEAARERLAEEARPHRPLALPLRESVLNAVRTVLPSADGILASLAFDASKRGRANQVQSIVYVARSGAR